ADAHEILAGGEQLFALLAELANALTVDQLRATLDRALTILTEDLGLTNEYVQAQVAALFDESIRQLRSPPAETYEAARANRLEIAALLRRVHRDLQGLFVLPALNADKLAGPLFDLLRKLNVDDATRRAGVASTAAKDALTAGVALTDLVPFSMG